jgi:hypothetical protein
LINNILNKLHSTDIAALTAKSWRARKNFSNLEGSKSDQVDGRKLAVAQEEQRLGY